MNASRFTVGFAATIALVSTQAMAFAAGSVSDLVGVRASSGESDLESRGYTYITGRQGSHKVHGYWWNPRDKSCIHVVTEDGRYSAITDAVNSDCNQKDSGNTAATAAAVVGIGLLVAALAHKSDQHDDGKHYQDNTQDSQFERGYNDGLHNASYLNNNKSDAYSRGYSAGVEQRSANLDYRKAQPDRGGYHPSVNVGDLNGARAAGADSELTRRGFANVDGFKSGNAAYTIWSKPDTHQCLQMTVTDGKVYDIRDIGTHPKCR